MKPTMAGQPWYFLRFFRRARLIPAMQQEAADVVAEMVFGRPGRIS